MSFVGRNSCRPPERVVDAEQEVIDLASPECITMLADYIRENPGVWNEDIGEPPPRSEAQ
jgi:hypothetical protein